MLARTSTRRQLLTRAAPGMLLAALLAACGQSTGSAATTTSVPGTTSPGAIAASGLSTRPASPPLAGGTQTSAPATPTLPTPTPTLSATRPFFMGDAGCSAAYKLNPQSGDPYVGGMVSEGAAIPFTEKVRRSAQLIVVGTVRDILPARWVTPDGRRPANTPTGSGLFIITPVRVEVERVAKGSYTLPDIYLAALGGRIGADCASYSGSGPRPAFGFGGRYLYFLDPFTESLPGPVPSDRQFQYYAPNYSYTVRTDGLIQIGPERDIMGYRADDPPRTLTVDEALREIATLLNSPAATPTR